MKMNKVNKWMLVAVALCVGVNANAQEEDGTIEGERIILKADYQASVSDAKKLAELPSIVDTAMPQPVPSYIFGNKPINTSYMPDSIQPARMKGEPLDPLCRNYIRIGAGNGINYAGDLYVNALRSRNGALGFDLHNRTSQGVIADLPPAPFSRWDGSVYGKRFFKKHALDARVGYDRERLQYYGYDETNPYYFTLTDEDDFKQVYQEVFANVGLKSFYTDSSKVNHVVQLHYDRFMDYNLSNTENNVLFNAELSRYFGIHQGRVELLTDVNNVNYADSFVYAPIGTIDANNTNIIFGLKPIITSQVKKFRVEYGANLQAEYTADGTQIRIYPHLYGKYNLIGDVLVPYAGLKGGMKRNSLNTLTETNPFLWTSLTPLRNTNEVFHVFGGFRGAVSNRFTYNLHAARYTERDAALFTNYDASSYNPGLSRFGENYFTVLYDTLQTFEIGGELTYRIDEKLQLIGTGVYRAYQTTAEFEAWQRPTMEATLNAFYQLRNKIIFKGQLNFIGPQWVKSYDPTSEKDFGFDGRRVYGDQLNPIVDINVGVEYRYTERLSGFLNFNNLIAQRYQRWNQYPNQRINVLGGITYSFWKE